jgi:hypothetical protein
MLFTGGTESMKYNYCVVLSRFGQSVTFAHLNFNTVNPQRHLREAHVTTMQTFLAFVSYSDEAAKSEVQYILLGASYVEANSRMPEFSQNKTVVQTQSNLWSVLRLASWVGV